ncbi:MAG: DUF305 domain-containing protein [Gemmatimonadota bacterium]
MRGEHRLRIRLIALLTIVAGGCATAPPERTAPPPQAGGMTAAEMEELFRARRDSARGRYTEADVAFMTGMIHHHAQALHMARLVPSRTESASMETLGARILNAQQGEIATMQTWLRERGEPVPELHVMDGRADHAMHGPLMPGMLTEAQLTQLEQAEGAAFDRLFLELMIQHHRGAVTMVHELFATGGAAQDEAVFKLASDVQADQRSEVGRMERMLAAMSGGAPS